MALDRWHTAFYANSFTLANFYVCVWGKMYGKMVDFFGILNYSWGSSILQVVLAEDLEFFHQHHMKCPALLQVPLAVLLFSFSLWFPCQPPSLLGCWLGRELHFAASCWDMEVPNVALRGCFSSSAPFSFALIPEQAVDTTCLEQAALCSLFPCSKLLLSFVWTDPVHTFPLSFQWGMETLTSLQ